MDTTLDPLKDRVAIVTGASAGIGEAIAEALVIRGSKVVGLARRTERLEAIANRLKNKSGKFYFLKTNVSKEDDIIRAFSWLTVNVGPVHVLVNNAGVMYKKGLIDGDASAWKNLLDINVLGLCIATKLAVNDMMKNGVSGHIIHINSVIGRAVTNRPYLNIYAASKSAVTALTETLRLELNSIGSEIKITSISPGSVHTEIAVAAGIIPEGQIAKMCNGRMLLKPEDVADSVVYVLSTPPHVQIHEIVIKPVGEIF